VRAFFAALFLTAVLTASASASTIDTVGFCGSFTDPEADQIVGINGIFVCPSAASLGVTNPVVGEFIVYDSDYSSGLNSSVSVETDWVFSGVTAAFSTDTTTSTGAGTSNPAVSSDGLTLNPLINLPSTVLAGFYDIVTGFGTPSVFFDNRVDTGQALQATGYAEVVYETATPEPASIPVVGGALLAAFLYRRKKLVRA
jgi:hypothetical protein